MTKLFRQEVIEAKRRRLYGDVKLSHPPSLTAWAGVITLLSLVVIAVLAFGTYVRKETVKGFLTPEDGIIHIYASSSARISSVLVREGDTVKAGTVLLRYDDQSAGSDTGELVASQLAEYEKQAANAALRSAAMAGKSASDTKRIQNDIEHQKASLSILEKRIANQSSLLDNLVQGLIKYETLRENGFASDMQLQAKKQQIMQVEDNINAMNMQLIAIQNQISGLTYDLRAISSEQDNNRAATSNELSIINQRRTDLNANYSTVSRAPVDSIIAGVQAQVGQVPVSNEPMISLMPKGSAIEAELLVPTRGAGFIAVGDEVRLNIDAYPFQHFGFVNGRVKSISRTVLRPNQFLAPIEMKESFYRVRVTLGRDFVMAYGRKKLLRPGMSLTADIITDRRRIWRQLLDPVLAASKRAS